MMTSSKIGWLTLCLYIHTCNMYIHIYMKKMYVVGPDKLHVHSVLPYINWWCAGQAVRIPC